jgi:hypothetical protein
MNTIRLLAASAMLALSVVAAPALAADDQPETATAPAPCQAPLEPWTEIDLYFGRNIAGIGEVTEQQFRDFVREVVTPRFPDGLTLLDALGQFRDGKRIVRERTKQLVLLVPEPDEIAGKVKFIVKEYKERFRQQSGLHTETSVCLSFD